MCTLSEKAFGGRVEHWCVLTWNLTWSVCSSSCRGFPRIGRFLRGFVVVNGVCGYKRRIVELNSWPYSVCAEYPWQSEWAKRRYPRWKLLRRGWQLPVQGWQVSQRVVMSAVGTRGPHVVQALSGMISLALPSYLRWWDKSIGWVRMGILYRLWVFWLIRRWPWCLKRFTSFSKVFHGYE